MLVHWIKTLIGTLCWYLKSDWQPSLQLVSHTRGWPLGEVRIHRDPRILGSHVTKFIPEKALELIFAG